MPRLYHIKNIVIAFIYLLSMFCNLNITNATPHNVVEYENLTSWSKFSNIGGAIDEVAKLVLVCIGEKMLFSMEQNALNQGCVDKIIYDGAPQCSSTSPNVKWSTMTRNEVLAELAVLFITSFIPVVGELTMLLAGTQTLELIEACLSYYVNSPADLINLEILGNSCIKNEKGFVRWQVGGGKNPSQIATNNPNGIIADDVDVPWMGSCEDDDCQIKSVQTAKGDTEYYYDSTKGCLRHTDICNSPASIQFLKALKSVNIGPQSVVLRKRGFINSLMGKNNYLCPALSSGDDTMIFNQNDAPLGVIQNDIIMSYKISGGRVVLVFCKIFNNSIPMPPVEIAISYIAPPQDSPIPLQVLRANGVLSSEEGDVLRSNLLLKDYILDNQYTSPVLYLLDKSNDEAEIVHLSNDSSIMDNTVCGYMGPEGGGKRWDLISLGEALINARDETSGSGAIRIPYQSSVETYLIQGSHALDTISQCIEMLLTLIFSGNNNGYNFINVIQTGCYPLIAASMTFFLCRLGYGIIVSHDLSRGRATKELIVMASGVYFATTKFLATTGIILIFGLLHDFAMMSLTSIESVDALQMCTQNLGGSNILGERKIYESDLNGAGGSSTGFTKRLMPTLSPDNMNGGSLPNSEPNQNSSGDENSKGGYVKLTFWSLIECHFFNIFNFGSCKYVLTQVFGMNVLSLCLLSGIDGFFLGISSLGIIWCLASVIGKTFHVYIISFIMCTVLFSLTPVWISFAFISEKTRGMSKQAITTLIGYILMMGLLGVMISVIFSSLYFGMYQVSPQFIQQNTEMVDGKIAVKAQALCGNNNSLGCGIINQRVEIEQKHAAEVQNAVNIAASNSSVSSSNESQVTLPEDYYPWLMCTLSNGGLQEMFLDGGFLGFSKLKTSFIEKTIYGAINMLLICLTWIFIFENIMDLLAGISGAPSAVSYAGGGFGKEIASTMIKAPVVVFGGLKTMMFGNSKNDDKGDS